MDPNDGYSSRVPLNSYHHRLPSTSANRNPALTKAKNPYLTAYKTIQIVSSTPEPSPAYHSTTEAPHVQINSQVPAINYEYETVPVNTYQTTAAVPTITYASPTPAPTIVSSTTPAPRQHLTETTQIRAPTEATYHPTHEHYNVYKPVVNKLNSAPKYKTTVLNRVVPVVDEPHFIVRPSAHLVHSPPPPPPPLPVIDYAINASSITTLLKKLQDSNHLPQTITPNNIDNSIRTLVKILNNLKHTQSVAEAPPQHYVEENDSNSHHDSGEDDYSDTDTKTNGGKYTVALLYY